MKQIFFAASACIGLFAFTTVGGSRNHIPTVSGSYNLTDTSHKPKPDSARIVAFHEVLDTMHKPKPDSLRSVVFNSVMADTSHKPKPDSLRSVVFNSIMSDTSHKPKPDSLSIAMR